MGGMPNDDRRDSMNPNNDAHDDSQAFATFREEIERLHIRDMLSLHKVTQFLKTKKVEGGFSNVRLGG